LSYRNIRAATGVSAAALAAISPAAGPCQRRTVAYSSAAPATPSAACGSRRLQEFRPNDLAASSMTHSDPGVLSTVMKFEASNDPKKNAFQLLLPAWTAAA